MHYNNIHYKVKNTAGYVIEDLLFTVFLVLGVGSLPLKDPEKEYLTGE